MVKKVAKIFGIVFIVVGLAGFVPGITYHERLIGVFHVNVFLNLLHLVTGIIAYWTSRRTLRASQLFFQVFAVVYAIMAVLGFGYGDRDILGVFSNDKADTWLHTLVALFNLYVGFFYKGK
jgi:hypothetical protein